MKLFVESPDYFSTICNYIFNINHNEKNHPTDVLYPFVCFSKYFELKTNRIDFNETEFVEKFSLKENQKIKNEALKYIPIFSDKKYLDELYRDLLCLKSVFLNNDLMGLIILDPNKFDPMYFSRNTNKTINEVLKGIQCKYELLTTKTKIVKFLNKNPLLTRELTNRYKTLIDLFEVRIRELSPDIIMGNQDTLTLWYPQKRALNVILSYSNIANFVILDYYTRTKYNPLPLENTNNQIIFHNVVIGKINIYGPINNIKKLVFEFEDGQIQIENIIAKLKPQMGLEQYPNSSNITVDKPEFNYLLCDGPPGFEVNYCNESYFYKVITMCMKHIPEFENPDEILSICPECGRLLNSNCKCTHLNNVDAIEVHFLSIEITTQLKGSTFKVEFPKGKHIQKVVKFNDNDSYVLDKTVNNNWTFDDCISGDIFVFFFTNNVKTPDIVWLSQNQSVFEYPLQPFNKDSIRIAATSQAISKSDLKILFYERSLDKLFDKDNAKAHIQDTKDKIKYDHIFNSLKNHPQTIYDGEYYFIQLNGCTSIFKLKFIRGNKIQIYYHPRKIIDKCMVFSRKGGVGESACLSQFIRKL